LTWWDLWQSALSGKCLRAENPALARWDSWQSALSGKWLEIGCRKAVKFIKKPGNTQEEAERPYLLIDYNYFKTKKLQAK